MQASKTAYFNLTVIILGLLPGLLWLLGTLEQILSAIDLDALPPEIASVLAALLSIVGGINLIIELRRRRQAAEADVAG